MRRSHDLRPAELHNNVVLSNLLSSHPAAELSDACGMQPASSHLQNRQQPAQEHRIDSNLGRRPGPLGVRLNTLAYRLQR